MIAIIIIPYPHEYNKIVNMNKMSGIVTSTRVKQYFNDIKAYFVVVVVCLLTKTENEKLAKSTETTTPRKWNCECFPGKWSIIVILSLI